MRGDVSFSDPHDLPEALAPFLPYNYLPAAFAAISGDPSARNRLLIVLPIPGELRTSPRYTIIDVKTLAKPLLTAQFVSALDGIPNPLGEVRIFLGPEVDVTPEMPLPPSNALIGINAAPLGEMAQDSFDVAVVIIDAGLAFWNRRFRAIAGPRFQEIRFLDIQRPDFGLGTANLLNAGQIAGLCNVADTGGSAAVMDVLGQWFPNSYYGMAGSADVDALWHGTAVADLAAGSEPGLAGAMDRVALFGIELPVSVLRDADGDALTAVLTILVDQVIEITKAISDKHVVVALPFGFVGGPQDGTHLAAKTIDDILTSHPDRAGRISFLVPAGNHLQDRCRARLPESQAGVSVLPVDWQIAPDDFSTNQIEILIDNVDPADGRASLRIAPPGSAAVQAIGLKAGQCQQITLDGAIVGLLLRHANVAMPPPQTDLRARLRLCLGPTGYGPGGMTPAPFGRWRLSTLSVQPVDLWVLRDDRDSVGDQAFPRRMSWLDDPLYEDTAQNGAPVLVNPPGSLVRRSGTLSVLATATSPPVRAVQADERLGVGPKTPAFYSGSPEPVGAALVLAMARMAMTGMLVDDGTPLRGVMVAANGTERRMRFSGTSAAVGLAAHDEALTP